MAILFRFCLFRQTAESGVQDRVRAAEQAERQAGRDGEAGRPGGAGVPQQRRHRLHLRLLRLPARRRRSRAHRGPPHPPRQYLVSYLLSHFLSCYHFLPGF